MLIEPIGGLANRIRVILAAILYCEDKQIDLYINWLNNPRLCHTQRVNEISGGHFMDVFLNETLSTKIKVNFIEEKEHIKELSTENSLPNFYRGTSPVIFENSIKNFKKLYLESYKRLTLNKDIKNQVEAVAASQKPYNSMHIRRTDHLKWLQRTNLEVTPLSKFEDFIREQSAERVFLATDCISTRDYFVKKYPKYIFYQGDLTQVEGAGERPSGLEQAVIDIFLCIKSQKFLGTKLSSFSGLIQILRRVI